ncbi:MAG TPA: YfjI family protein [Verrucomicrobiales bacterium]|nr:YfjI family protein [Verrucomicrobiales bacterium]
MEPDFFDPAQADPVAYSKATAAATAADDAAPSVPEDEVPLSDPSPLPSGLSPVLPFTPEMLPEALRPWLLDITERIGCPIEFPAVAAISAAGSVLGRKVGIHPKGQDDWYELANLWALLIGRPSMMKSPAMIEALRPLRALEAAALQAHKEAEQTNRENAMLAKIRREVAASSARRAVKSGQSPDIAALLEDAEAEATLRRYSATDTSAESLVELCRQNPNGIVLLADEMSGLLSLLDKPGNEALRSLYLMGWSGKGGYTLDRVGRGMNIGAPSVCLSIIGGIQPDVMRRHLFNAENRSVDDGFTQRFQLAVWPDDNGDWHFIDRPPNSDARGRALDVFTRLDRLDPLEDLSASLTDPSDESRPPCLRFTDEARTAFAAWMEANHRASREAGETSSALEATFGKYPKLVSGLALLFHIIDYGTGPVGMTALLRAIQWTAVLATHARRIFDAGESQTIATAHRIISRIQDASLPIPFTARNIYRPQWAGLKDRRLIDSALAILEHHGWVTTTTIATGGHPLEIFTPHPKIHKSPAAAH